MSVIGLETPSLRLFYNYGRLPVVKYWSGVNRLSMKHLDHDKEWVRGPDGLHCKFCGTKLKGYNRKFCGGTNCEREYERLFVQFDCWAWFRERVFDRDNGHCVKCGKELADKQQRDYGKGYYWTNQLTYVCDHIVPLFKGGLDWWQDPGMINFQTLCEDCNKIKTKADVSKPKVIKQKLDLNIIQYAGFVFQEVKPVNHKLEEFCIQ